MGMCTNDFVIGKSNFKNYQYKDKAKNVTLNGKYLVLDFMIHKDKEKKMISLFEADIQNIITESKSYIFSEFVHLA